MPNFFDVVTVHQAVAVVRRLIQVQHVGIAKPMKSPQLGNVVGSAINMTGVPKDIRIATATAGANTDEVLKSVGYTDKELAQLRAKGVI